MYYIVRYSNVKFAVCTNFSVSMLFLDLYKFYENIVLCMYVRIMYYKVEKLFYVCCKAENVYT